MVRIAVIAALLSGLTACSVLVESNFNDCAFEASKATVAVDNAGTRRANRDELTHFCMKARGFDVVGADADKGSARSYRHARWF